MKTAVTFVVGDPPNFDVPEIDPIVIIHEPAIDVAKSVTTPDTTTDAGEIVTYTLTLSHNDSSSAAGFELSLVDQLDPDMRLIAGSAIVSGPQASGLSAIQPGDVTLDTVNNRVLASGFDLGLGQVVTITYQARVDVDVVSGHTLTNNVDLTYRSLPNVDPIDNLNPSTGAPGAPNGPRDGSGGPPRTDQAILNNYAFETSATVTIAQPGPIEKTSARPTYTIGEIISYTINIPVIEGMTLNPVVTDLLPEGLAYVDGSGVGVDGNGVPISNIVESFIVSGRTLTLDLISFQTAADNNPNNDFIRLSFDARVLNVFANNNGDTKTNTVTFSSEGQPDRTDAVNIGIVEPNLVVTKGNDAGGPVDAGDIITYTVTVAGQRQPRLTVSPVDRSDGTRPRKAINCRGLSKRRTSPTSLAKVTATMKETPRSA